MRKSKPPYAAKRHPEPTYMRRWACVDTRDGSIVSIHRYRANAIAVAALSNSIAAKYGSLYMEANNNA